METFDLSEICYWFCDARLWKKRFFWCQNSLKNSIYPATLESLWVAVVLITAIHFAGYKVPYDLVGKVSSYISGSSILAHLVGSFVVALFLWLAVVYAIRNTLKLLFLYKGWMYEVRGKDCKPSKLTQVWLLLVKLFSGWHKPMLYSFQELLPRLPLPTVPDTIKRYLKSIRPLLDDENYARMEKLASEFQNGIGVKLQRYLVLKSWWATNYVTDWWEEYVYLRGRSPIIVSSNYYGIHNSYWLPTNSQVARTAGAIWFCLQYRRLIERQKLAPILVQGLVPLCSWQYERVFNTTRIPGIECDKIVHYQDAKHIVVYHKGKYFKVLIYYRNRILQACEIELQIQQILDDNSTPSEGEEKLAALTAGERTAWAQARKDFFAKGVNKASLDIIEKAAFVVALDDVPYEYDPKHPEKLDNCGRILLHGKGHDRWFDKSFMLCTGNNGRIGFNVNHSWADATIMAHVGDYITCSEFLNQQYKDGHNVGTPEFTPPAPTRLQWNLNTKCIEAIEQSYKVAYSILNDVELRVYLHDAYGKGLIKANSISPDGYIQMALQLAYYRDAGKFDLTYEASITRLFRNGRTETVRSCTIESCRWVKAMEDKMITVKERVKLLMDAVKRHQKNYLDAMCGKGIDRHLFGLYVVSKYLEIDSPFLKEVLSEPWLLSTSQTPQGLSLLVDFKKHPNCLSFGGGFGPATDDGYGVSYTAAGEDLLFFHVCSKRSSSKTDAARFVKQIEKALSDMKDLLEQNKKIHQSESA
ncbi:carnitine O-palmitoyltransferase 1, liver isoform-like isoform X1 [Solenopsis invicta]|uniref:carnitine O-palmitoyltransferase 1, liver isoform-like isoform X1 n=1 Tax=Solenopsis invicta TaxID=13686 RepID=UPI00193DFFBD|nr:carnitine O-palmitoyltransferase 1, liver isoform-like isoform X1 [Solenopsis invicta]